jgi:iron complex transport system ATP-binding protein
VLLRGGRIVADGPKDKVLSTAQLSELFGVPVRVARDDGYFHLY